MGTERGPRLPCRYRKGSANLKHTDDPREVRASFNLLIFGGIDVGHYHSTLYYSEKKRGSRTSGILSFFNNEVV